MKSVKGSWRDGFSLSLQWSWQTWSKGFLIPHINSPHQSLSFTKKSLSWYLTSHDWTFKDVISNKVWFNNSTWNFFDWCGTFSLQQLRLFQWRNKAAVLFHIELFAKGLSLFFHLLCSLKPGLSGDVCHTKFNNLSSLQLLYYFCLSHFSQMLK